MKKNVDSLKVLCQTVKAFEAVCLKNASTLTTAYKIERYQILKYMITTYRENKEIWCNM